MKRLHASLFAAALAAAFMLTQAWAQNQPAPDTIAAIKARGKLLAGVKYDTPPFGFLDKSNQVVGFDVDIVTRIAEAIGVPVELVSVTSPTRIPMLSSGNVDLVAASMTHTRSRDETIDFSITYYTGGQSLLVPAKSAIKSVKDLAGKKVAVQQGTTLEKNLAKAAPKANIVGFKDYNSAWLALRQGRVEALTGSIDILQGFAKNEKGFRLAGGRFSDEPFAVGVRQGDSALRDKVNSVIQDLWTSGQYKELYRKWFGADPDIPIEVWPQ
jgi:ABC-type amino acid transport substrate-binding protein